MIVPKGVSAEHGSGRKITNDCSHFVTQIGDLKSIKKIYDKMCDTYLCYWNLTITRYSKMRNMEPARLLFDDSSDKKFVPEKEVCFESNSIMLISINVASHGGMKGNGDTNQNGKGWDAVNIKVSDSHLVAEEIPSPPTASGLNWPNTYQHQVEIAPAFVPDVCYSTRQGRLEDQSMGSSVKRTRQ